MSASFLPGEVPEGARLTPQEAHAAELAFLGDDFLLLPTRRQEFIDAVATFSGAVVLGDGGQALEELPILGLPACPVPRRELVVNGLDPKQTRIDLERLTADSSSGKKRKIVAGVLGQVAAVPMRSIDDIFPEVADVIGTSIIQLRQEEWPGLFTAARDARKILPTMTDKLMKTGGLTSKGAALRALSLAQKAYQRVGMPNEEALVERRTEIFLQSPDR